jgi:hypothetical protein
MAMKHIAALSLILFGIPAITYAQTPNDVRDLVGARAAGGETQLQARGYRFLRTNTVGDQKWSFWWSDLQRQCVSVTTDNGRYSAINQVPGQNCQTNPSTNEAYQGDSPFRPALGSPGETVSLLCYGQGEAAGIRSHSGYAYNPDTRKYEYGNRIESTTDGYDADLLIEIRDGQGRIHLTGRLIAPLNSGGQAGWWDLSDLRVTPDQISGRYRMNGLNSPSVDIDRRTGRIEIGGLEHFNGHCDKGVGRRF